MRHLSGGEAGGAEKKPRILKEQRNEKGNVGGKRTQVQAEELY